VPLPEGDVRGGRVHGATGKLVNQVDGTEKDPSVQPTPQRTTNIPARPRDRDDPLIRAEGPVNVGQPFGRVGRVSVGGNYDVALRLFGTSLASPTDTRILLDHHSDAHRARNVGRLVGAVIVHDEDLIRPGECLVTQ
jgi:hypothetical protein